ncbi:transglutaminase domain-containing protein [bacterium]|nr:transglutaminase domain-containing protein [bacterium]
MFKIKRDFAFLFFTLFVCLWCSSSVGQCGELTLNESWDIVQIAGAKVGYTHSQTIVRESEGKTIYASLSDAELSLIRGHAAARVMMSTEIVEDSAGQILSFYSKMVTSGQPVISRGKSIDGKLFIEQITLGKTRQYEIYLPPDAIGPFAATKLMVKKGFSSGTKYDIRTFEPQMSKIITLGIESLGKEAVQIGGKRRMLNKLRVNQDIMPLVPMLEWCTDAGEILKTETKRLSMVTLRSTKQQALRESESPKTDLIKLFSAPCSIFIPHPYITTEARYLLDMPDGEAASLIPEDAVQMLSQKKEGLVLRVKPLKYGINEALPPRLQGKQWGEFLKPSTYIQSDDPKIIQLSKTAVGSANTSYEAATKLCRWVGNHISLKDYSVGFASAKEVAENKRGDCTEHSVLLAAMLRSVGIPSRVVAGLLFVDGDFFYHAWNEAFVGEWMPLDATLKRGGNEWDAVHIKLAQTSFSSPAGIAELAPVASSMGAIKLKVLSFAIAGRSFDMEGPNSISILRGNRYENFAYSFAIEKPARTAFTKARPLLSSATIICVTVPILQKAQLVIEAKTVAFHFNLKSFLQAKRASGMKFSGVRHLSIDGRPAVKYIETSNSATTHYLLVYDRDVLLTLRADGDEKWQKKIFQRACESLTFLGATQ